MIMILLSKKENTITELGYFKFGCSYKNFSLRKSLISDAMHCKIASCKLHMHMSLTEDINEINEIPPQS